MIGRAPANHGAESRRADGHRGDDGDLRRRRRLDAPWRSEWKRGGACGSSLSTVSAAGRGSTALARSGWWVE